MTVIRSSPSNQKVGYDEVSGEKVFRVTTTNQRPRLLNAINNNQKLNPVAQST
jgi:hypothetical protein